MPKAIGIDLGTSFSSVAVFQNGHVEIIRNDYGIFTTPSYVAFVNKERIVGDRAKHQNPLNTIFHAHRVIARKLYDSSIQSDIHQWPFSIITAEDGSLKILVQYKNEIKAFWAEKILSIILKYLKKCAEDYIGDSVKDAVISVPTCFNYLQRESIKEAATLGGLNVLKLISSTNAAALAFNFNRNKEEKTIMVFDFGGGSLGVSILTTGDSVAVESVSGDSHLGGEDFDNLLIDYFVDEFKFKYKKDILLNPRALCRLRNACENAKKILSNTNQASIQLDSLFDGINFYTNISREFFEEFCSDIFQKIPEFIEKALRDAKMDKNEIDEIILVGGSTRIPKIQQLISDFFPGKPLNKSLNPDEAIAYGAAIEAAILSGNETGRIQHLLLLDVAPFSLGIKTFGGIFNKIVKRNSRIPSKFSQTYTTYSENQSDMTVNICEGEGGIAKDNQLLAKFKFNGIPPAPKGVPQIEITFDINTENFLTVFVRDKLTGIKKVVNISKYENPVPYMFEDEKEEFQYISIKEQLLNFCYSIKQCIEDVKAKNRINEKDYQEVREKLNEIFFWIHSDHSLKNKKEFQNRKKELQSIWNPIIIRLYKSVGYTEALPCKQIK